jgi:predicted enzyme related to lactoylglutathione lyase
MGHILVSTGVMEVDRSDRVDVTAPERTSRMTTGMRTVIFPVKDLDRAKAVFTALLGTEPAMDQPYYVGYEAPGIHLGLDPNGHAQGMTGPVGFWQVSDLAATRDALVAAGATVAQDARDVGGGRLVATLRDADGNPIGLLQDPGDQH